MARRKTPEDKAKKDVPEAQTDPATAAESPQFPPTEAPEVPQTREDKIRATARRKREGPHFQV